MELSKLNKIVVICKFLAFFLLFFENFFLLNPDPQPKIKSKPFSNTKLAVSTRSSHQSKSKPSIAIDQSNAKCKPSCNSELFVCRRLLATENQVFAPVYDSGIPQDMRCQSRRWSPRRESPSSCRSRTWSDRLYQASPETKYFSKKITNLNHKDHTLLTKTILLCGSK